MKKSGLIATLSCLCLLVGCGKKITKQEAAEFAKENYSAEKASEAFSAGSYKTVTKVSKAEGVFEKLFKDGETTGSVSLIPTVAGDIASASDKTVITLSGSKLSFSYTIKDAELKEMFGYDGIKGSMKATASYNEYGLLVKSTEVIDIDFSATTMGVTVSGALKASIVQTCTYTKK